jgi:hypothetical protein
VNRYRKYEGQNNSDLIKDAAQSLDVIEKAIVNQSRSLDDISEMLPKRKEYLASHTHHSTCQERRPKKNGFRLWMAL